MAGKPIEMNKLRKTLQLYVQGKSKVFISESLGLSRNSVKKYIRQFIDLKVTFDVLEKLDDLSLEELFFKSEKENLPPKLKTLYDFFPYVEKQLKKTGVTKLMLWEEYKLKQPEGVQSTQFCEHYNRWSRQIHVDPVMHLNHKAGDMMYIDYAGETLQIIDRETGEIIDVQFFVAILGASQLTYAEASLSQKSEDFITSVENALHYFGGVPQGIKPDNLKSAVTKSDRYEPKINETFQQFADHYSTTVVPARSRKPRDKALVENAVKILYTRIYTMLQNQQFYEIPTLNQAILQHLEKHNNTHFTSKPFSRRQLFDELEKAELSTLPTNRFEIRKVAMVTVMNNGHVSLSEDKHYYSVPFLYIRKKVKILYGSKTVEIYHKHNRIAVHARVKSPYNYTTVEDHMASTHRFMTEWTPQRFMSWATSLDKDVEMLIHHILNKKQHPEQAYKSCMGVLSLEKKVGKERLIKACSTALKFGIYNYKIILTILEKGWDQSIEDPNESEDLPRHGNIRGSEYYK